MFKYIHYLQLYFSLLETPSAWSECALVLPVDVDLGWCAWLSGFSLSLWLRLERGAAPESSPTRVEHPWGLHRNYSGHLSDSLSDSWSEWGVVSSASWLKDGQFNSIVLLCLWSFKRIVVLYE